MTTPHAKLTPPLRALALERFARFSEYATAAGVEIGALTALPGDAECVWACSEFVADACCADPALLEELLRIGDLERDYAAGDYRAALDVLRAKAAEDEAAFATGLRRLRRREMVRIAWRDIGRLSDLENTLRETSAFADAVVEAATTFLEHRGRERYGTPRSASGEAQHLVVLGLGKLGAEELNFSSDIDLIFAFAEAGETDHPRRAASNEEFFAHLGRRLIQLLSEPTGEGSVFRVDMRLRPFGASGPLAMSFDALEHYYQLHGRDWERYALIRARALTGSAEARREIQERLRPFVFRRYLDFSALEALRDMKRTISVEMANRGLEDDLKLGPGGIREIEFTGQAFQMVRGGRIPQLRSRRIVEVLAELGKRDLLAPHAVDELCAAYRFLRASENRLQEWRDQQTHRLPDAAPGRARLAAAMGFEDWERYATTLARHRARVSAQFAQVFGAVESGQTSEQDALELLWHKDPDPDRACAILAATGFEEADSAYQVISEFKARISHHDRRAHQRLRRLFPQLLTVSGAQRDPTTTLRRVLDILAAIASRSVYLALLTERPMALAQLVRLCAASPFVAREIGRHPLLLDELLDPRTLYAPPQAEALRHELARRMESVAPGDVEQEMDVLRQFKQASVLRVAAADLSRAVPLMVVSDHLTWIAEALLQRVVELAWRDCTARYGEPMYRDEAYGTAPRRAAFAVLAYGKLGGIELGYASDLDIVFVHGSAGADQHTNGERSVENAVFFGRLATRIIHYLSTPTAGGVLYEVDARLRPGGASGLMVASIAGLEHYLREEAWTWEHQALVRARCVAGDSVLAGRLAALRREVLLQPRDPVQLRREVREMRERMRTELAQQTPGEFDLKQGEGGITDIEFMVQYAVLRWASRLASHLAFTDNIRLLEGLARHHLMRERDATALSDIYRGYRQCTHALALQERPAVVADREFVEQRAEVRRIWAALMED